MIGNYRIVSELGKGGMGIVYRAEHVQLGRPVALKMLLPALSHDPGIVQRFFNEARAASAIDHPGIVEVYDFGTHTDGRAYIVMALLKGESLEHRLHRAGIDPLEGASIVAQVVGALAAAHARGIVHRDLKPDNIFLVPNELMTTGIQVKLLDFGIAKLADEHGTGLKTQTGALIGTPAYMSPEQCMGRSDLDHRTDLYAIGCILFHVLCGRPPFVSEHGTGMMIAAHLRDVPVDPQTINPHVPVDLARIVLRLLEKDPAARYQSATELRAALIHAGATAPTVPPAVGATLASAGSSSSRYSGPEAYGATTAPTTGSGSAAQVVARTPNTLPPARSRAAWLVVGGLLIALIGVGIFVAATQAGGGTTKIAAREPPVPPPSSPMPPMGASSATTPTTPSPPTGAVPKETSPAGATGTREPAALDATVPTKSIASAPLRSECAKGKVRNDDTRGNCCWPAQAWSSAKNRCVGRPLCPKAMQTKGEQCVEEVAVVGAPTTGQPTPLARQRFTVVNKTVQVGEMVSVRFPEPLVALKGERFWITVILATAPAVEYDVWEYVPDGARTLSLAVPLVPGSYEVRLHGNYPTKSTNLVYRAPITVE